MLDADSLARVSIGEASDVAGGERVGRAGLQVLVDEHSAVYCDASCFSQSDRRAHARTDDHQFGRQAFAVVHVTDAWLMLRGRVPRWKTSPCPSGTLRLKAPSSEPMIRPSGTASG